MFEQESHIELLIKVLFGPWTSKLWNPNFGSNQTYFGSTKIAADREILIDLFSPILYKPYNPQQHNWVETN